MKTLIVKYLPRGNNSFTKKLLKSFEDNITGKIKILDLLEDTPEYFDTARLAAYIQQNYAGSELPPEEKQLLAKMERFAGDVAEADIVVLATPMHNFSYPALVKAWFDSVMLKGITWTSDENGNRGLCEGKTAVLLFASGGKYSGESAGWDHLTPITEQSFRFMGFSDFKVLTIGGLNLPETDREKATAEAAEQAQLLAKELYK